jgi:hypothetical protein
MDDAGQLTAPGKSARHSAETEVKLGRFSATSRLSLTTGGLLAVTGLVGVILSGTAAIVWVATAPARRRAEQGKSRESE